MGLFVCKIDLLKQSTKTHEFFKIRQKLANILYTFYY